MAPVKNSLTKLDRLPLDPGLERVPFLVGRDSADCAHPSHRQHHQPNLSP